jgi:alpha-beta hydrolase superfamily lysophospholipase
MKEIRFKIETTPAILWGESAENMYLFVHGRNGCKETAVDFAQIAVRKDWAVLSIDLPEHGERKQEKESFNPWCVVPELRAVMSWAKQRWLAISLRADSIGAWFSMLSFGDDKLENCLFVSPILDMEKLICNMMRCASVSEKRLKQEREIETDFGEILSWQYLDFVKKHPIKKWNAPTAILYAEKDNLTERNIIDKFVAQFRCKLTVAENGEHWFHTSEQLEILDQWTEALL